MIFCSQNYDQNLEQQKERLMQYIVICDCKRFQVFFHYFWHEDASSEAGIYAQPATDIFSTRCSL